MTPLEIEPHWFETPCPPLCAYRYSDGTWCGEPEENHPTREEVQRGRV